MYEVDEIENVWIPMPDGARLAARLWLPRLASGECVPAIFEYLPYHKRDLHRASDDTRHPAWAAHGYACLRVDIRGSGDSDGAPQDEYVQQEQDDGEAVIAWIAAQRWCTGSVGMVGMSWGGINALQLAARNPPALKAVISHCSTADRYAGDAHYKGGCILMDQQLWGTIWLAFQATPPDPAVVGEGWREQWERRLEQLECHLATWMEHPRRDAFWQHASVAADYAAIRCPVYAIGGLADPYRTWVFELLEHLTVPCKGLLGPWGHAYPHEGEPAPTIDYVAESLRWWDHWLKGCATGIVDEPALQAWMEDETPLAGSTTSAGRWVAEPQWPPPCAQVRCWMLNVHRLDAEAAAPAALTLAPSQTVGIAAGRWVGFVPRLDLPPEQSVDDARSLCFDSEPFDAALEVLGQPALELEISVDQPVAFLVARLNDVSPTGASHRVTYALLNLCHRDSDREPTPVVPGKRYRLRLKMDAIAHRFRPGHRIRIALSTAYWPLMLPTPAPVTLTCYTGSGALRLPLRSMIPGEPSVRSFAPPPSATSTAESTPAVAPVSRVDFDPSGHVQSTYRVGGLRTHLFATGTEITRRMTTRTSIHALDPVGAWADQRVEFVLQRGDWQPKVEAFTRIDLAEDHFEVRAEVTATDGERLVARRAFQRTVPRHLV